MNNLGLTMLPKDLQDIIYTYKHQLDFSECVKEINEIEYETYVDWEEYTISTRKYKNKETTHWLVRYAIGIDFWISGETGTTWIEKERGDLYAESEEESEYIEVYEHQKEIVKDTEYDLIKLKKRSNIMNKYKFKKRKENLKVILKNKRKKKNKKKKNYY